MALGLGEERGDGLAVEQAERGLADLEVGVGSGDLGARTELSPSAGTQRAIENVTAETASLRVTRAT